MKVKFLRRTDHRISPAVTQEFKADAQADLPKATATKLIADGAAEAITPPKPSTAEKD